MADRKRFAAIAFAGIACWLVAGCDGTTAATGTGAGLPGWGAARADV